MLMIECAVRHTCIVSRVPPSLLYGPRRHRYLVRPRWALALALSRGGYTNGRIARWLKRDRTTIDHALAQAKYLEQCDEAFAFLVQSISSQVRPAVDRRRANTLQDT